MFKKKYILLLSLSLFLFLFFIFFKKESKKNIVFGIASHYAPYCSINELGDYEGFDIDLINALNEDNVDKITYIDLGSMSSLFLALDQGMIDGIIWGMSITKDRLAKYDMIHYIGEPTLSMPMIYIDHAYDDITLLENAKNMTFGIEAGSIQDNIVQKYTNISIQYVDKIDDALLHLENKKIDALLIDPVMAKKFLSQKKNLKVTYLPICQEDQEYGVGIVIKKNNTLKNTIEMKIKKIKEDNIIKHLSSKWGL